jgi:hypothetical protein
MRASFDKDVATCQEYCLFKIVRRVEFPLWLGFGQKLDYGSRKYSPGSALDGHEIGTTWGRE